MASNPLIARKTNNDPNKQILSYFTVYLFDLFVHMKRGRTGHFSIKKDEKDNQETRMYD
jgi:hypothetical protein